MNSKEARNSMLTIVGILGLVLLGVLTIMQFGRTGFGLVGGQDPVKVYDSVPAKVLVDGKNYEMIIRTNYGDVKYDLLENNAPTTVNNFVFLAKDKFYDGTRIHRVEKDFVIQGGSRLSLDNNPANDGFGGPGYKFDNEINWDSLNLSSEVREQLTQQGFASDTTVTSVAHEKYAMSMANAGAGTNGSQFFIVTGNSDDASIQSLNGKHTVFAKIISGQSVIDQINALERTETDPNFPQPSAEVVISSIEILEV